MARRFDAGTMSKVRKTDQGYIRCKGRITRTGVFQYRKQDGSLRRELRLPAEVFNDDSVESFGLAPLTNDHPSESLTAKNTRKFQVGSVSGLKRDENFLLSDIQITDEETIAAIDGGKRELSCGYTCDLDFVPGVTDGIEGVPDGLRYDAIQRNIRGNHVAIVMKGRAGPSAALHMDAEDAIMIEELEAAPDQQELFTESKGEPKMAENKVSIDGVDYEVSEQAAQAVTKVIGKFDQLKESLAAEKARADKAEEELVTEKAAHKADSAPEKVQELVKARVALEQSASKILGKKTEDGEDLKLDGMTDEEIMTAVVVKLSKSDDVAAKLKDGGEGYLQARFDQALESFVPGTDTDAMTNKSVNSLRASIGHADGEKRGDAASSRERMKEEYRNLWKAAPAVN